MDGNFNPRSPCGERHGHAAALGLCPGYFNPRSPCGERRRFCRRRCRCNLFQSTLPLRGATKQRLRTIWNRQFQSTLPLRGATQRDGGWGHPPLFQSTLPLRGATFAIPSALPSIGFQSTLPLRGATVSALVISVFPCISIHAPLAGSDHLCH